MSNETNNQAKYKLQTRITLEILGGEKTYKIVKPYPPRYHDIDTSAESICEHVVDNMSAFVDDNIERFTKEAWEVMKREKMERAVELKELARKILSRKSEQELDVQTLIGMLCDYKVEIN